jgi:hypothetical protein
VEIRLSLLILPFKDTFHITRVMKNRVEAVSHINVKNKNKEDELILYSYNEQYGIFLVKKRY